MVSSRCERAQALDARQVRSGLAEAVKLAVISSPQLLAFIEDTPQRWYKRPARIDAIVEVRTTTTS